MRNKRQWGNYLQDRVAEYLEKRGYAVHNQKPVAHRVETPEGLKWTSKRNDILGCIDILAIHPEKRILFIQVTGHSDIKGKERKIKKIKWNLDFCEVMVWQYMDKGRWRIFRLEKDGTGKARLYLLGELRRGKLLIAPEREPIK